MEDGLVESVKKESGRGAVLCANRKGGSNVDSQNDSGRVRVCQEFSSDSSERRDSYYQKGRPCLEAQVLGSIS